ncbi:MAG: cupin domain-containing protein [Actinobacteria bacterium]|nr:cupin domain-containing protein [Actinomycetota bacterium]
MEDAANIWDEVPDWGGAGARRLVRSGSGLGGSIWEFQPGEPEFVYHFHHGSDELLVVLRGEPRLRLRDAERTLHEGEVVPLPRGPEGGRSISNPSDSVVRILMLSSNADPDVSEYPETGKLGVITDGVTWEFFRRGDGADDPL